MTLYRVVHNKDNPYLTINTTIATDTRLSWKAKGIWFYAFSRKDDWQFYEADLIKRSTDEVRALRAGLRELEKFGYLFRPDQQKGKNGKFQKREWYFFETPKTEEEIKIILPQCCFATTQSATAQNASAQESTLLSNEEPSIDLSNKEDKNIARTSQSESKQPTDFYFCHEKKKFIGIEENDWQTWRELYPCIDTKKETLKAVEWLRSNPSKSRKKNWRKFLTGWFSRANEKADNQAAYRAARNGTNISGEQHCAIIEENREFAKDQIAKIPVDKRKLLGIASAFDDHARVKIGNTFAPLGYTENGFKEQFVNLLRKGGHI